MNIKKAKALRQQLSYKPTQPRPYQEAVYEVKAEDYLASKLPIGTKVLLMRINEIGGSRHQYQNLKKG